MIRCVRVCAWLVPGLLAGSLSASGCGGVNERNDDDDGGDDGSDDDDGDDGGDDDDGAPGSFTVTATRDRLLLRRGESATIDVAIEREGATTGPIVVEASPLPPGVTAEPVTVAADEAGASLTLTAASDATQGAGSIDITGTAGDATSTAAIRLLVGGAPGTLDESFADAGRFTTRIGSLATFGRGLCLQPDGKIVVAGATQTQAMAVRIDDRGVLDPDFGTGGKVSTGVGPTSGGLVAAAFDGGRIIVAGYGGEAGYDLALFAYTAGGVLDEDFGPGGTVTTDLGTGTGEVHQLLPDGNGNILALGALFADPAVSRLVRYDTGGTHDAAFGATLTGAIAETATPLPDGRIILAGTQDGDYWVARLLDTGELDKDFAGGGTTTFDFDGGTDTVFTVLLLDGGKLALFGVTSIASSPVLSIARLNSNGSPDLTFGEGGQLLTAIPFETRATALMDQAGRVIVAGRIPGRTRPQFAILRLDGESLDPTFGDAGRAIIEFDAERAITNHAYGLAIDSDGRIIVSGEVGPQASASAAAVRLWP
jgi:uncharacterized delta-60 repeat protein